MKAVLGLDVGTTKSAAVIVDVENRRLLAMSGMAHDAGCGDGVQDPARHLAVMRRLIGELPGELRTRLVAVGVTGQMHGALAWNGHGAATRLYTWQSTVPELQELQRIAPDLRHGFGIASLARMARSGESDGMTHAATIHDYLVWQLTGARGPAVSDESDAASWGAFDLEQHAFRTEVVRALGVNPALLPQVAPVGARAGFSAAGWGIPAGLPVCAAVGDNQASVLATATDPETEIYLTLGTGAQLSVVTAQLAAGIECRPFCDGRYLAVAAPLCGGAAWAWLHAHVKAWLAALGLPPVPDRELYDRIDELALAEFDAPDLPIIAPHFLGERAAPELRGSMANLNLQNYTPGKVAAALALGIVGNLAGAMPAELRRGRGRLLVSGNAVRRTRALQEACRRVFGLEPALVEGQEEAARGAAELAGRLLS